MTHQRSQTQVAPLDRKLFGWKILLPVILLNLFLASDSLDNQSSDYSSSNFTWSLTGDDSNQFQLDVNGNLTFRRSMDYENPTDLNSDNLYEIIIRATDNSVDYSEYPFIDKSIQSK